jgi:hypothetical protein
VERTLCLRVTGLRLCAILLAVLVSTTVIAAIWTYRSVTGTFHDAYATWHAGDAVAYHLQRTGEWPRSWEDLRQDFASVQNYGPDDAFESIRNTVDIDFCVDPARLKALPEWTDLSNPPFRVIRAKSGRRAYLNEPNWIVWASLNGKYGPTTVPTSAPSTQQGEADR